jgi:hypothetical protein
MPPPRQPLPPVGHLSLPPSCATADGQVGADDPAFANPTKPVGAVYTEEEAESKRLELGWEVRPDGEHWRRVVPSPLPTSILQARTPLPAPPPKSIASWDADSRPSDLRRCRGGGCRLRRCCNPGAQLAALAMDGRCSAALTWVLLLGRLSRSSRCSGRRRAS